MPNLVALFRRLADEIEKEEQQEQAGQASQATEERIAAIEAALKAAPADEKKDALEELSEEERELIRAHRSGGKPPAEEPPKEEPKEEKPARRREKLTEAMPRIWSGESEPDIVEYEDESGAVKVRKGRKKDQPYGFEIEELTEATG